jgi:glycerophosphoryl diester phosphodiesterase
VIAHRAGNDIGSIHVAHGMGAHVIEADVHLFRGQLEARHARTVGPLPILVDRWLIRGPRHPRTRLEDVFAAMPQDAVLMLDLKGRSHQLVDAVQPLLERTRAMERSVIVCARHWPLLESLQGAPYVHPVHSVGRASQLQRLLRLRHAEGSLGVSIHERLLTPHAIAQLRRRAQLVMSWPVNSVERARELLDAGIHGLISDRPAVVAALLQRGSAHE